MVVSHGCFADTGLNPKPVRSKLVILGVSLSKWSDPVTTMSSPPWPDSLLTMGLVGNQSEPPEPPDPPDSSPMSSIVKRTSTALGICKLQSQLLVFDRTMSYLLRKIIVFPLVIITSVRGPFMVKPPRAQLSTLGLSIKMACILLLYNTTPLNGYMILKYAIVLNRICLNGSTSHGVNPKSLWFWCLKYKCKSNTNMVMVVSHGVNPEPLWFWCLKYKCKSNTNTVTVVETDEELAIKTALSQTINEDIRSCSVKSDALQLISAAIRSAPASKPHGFLHEESISFSFSLRIANIVANIVAKSTMYELVKLHY